MGFCAIASAGIRLGKIVLSAALLSASQVSAASFGAPTLFSFGMYPGVGVGGADAITYGGGSLWVAYGNGASSRDYSGNSIVIQFSLTGTIQQKYTIPGSVDGLKYNPNTGTVWALQNQDALSQLSIITPGVAGFTTYTYGAPYSSVSGTRGFDDVAFIGNSAYLSETNPGSINDPVIVKLDNTTLSSPLTVSTVLTGAGIKATDPDSLQSTPTGGLILTGGRDGTLTLVTNPGQANQSATSISLSFVKPPPGFVPGATDDSIYATASSGTFYLTESDFSAVYAISATGLTTSDLFVNVANAFGSVDPNTGMVTPIFFGTNLHGLEFVPSAAAVPEPATLGILFAGLALIGAAQALNRLRPLGLR